MADDALPFDEVYRRHREAVYWFCLSQTRNRAVAEDICSDVFTSALAAYERTKPDPIGVQAWLFRIARNAITENGRHSVRWTRLMAGLTGERRHTVETVAAIRDDVRAINDALATLPERDRRLIGLRVAGGLSFADIGNIEGITDDTAEAATRRALKRLRELLSEGNAPGQKWTWAEPE